MLTFEEMLFCGKKLTHLLGIKRTKKKSLLLKKCSIYWKCYASMNGYKKMLKKYQRNIICSALT